MSYFSDVYRSLIDTPIEHWLQTLPGHLDTWYQQQRHGDFDKWQKLVDKLPKTQVSEVDLKTQVRFGLADDIDVYTQKKIEGLLKLFHPWRKGPFDIHGIHLDTEWRSDWKWDRLLPHISNLKDRCVLDIGCGSGYHMWRMLGEQARLVIGIDPTQLFLMQFKTMKHFHPDPNIHLVPLGIEEMPELKAFDTVFCMGVLYHRRSPIDFLNQLKAQARPGGEVILETLVVEGDENHVLVPGERYAQMRNVWFIPSCLALEHWMKRCGFKNVTMVDKNQTSLEEQRSTEWMKNQSLVDFLDPSDHNKTIEGYPAPLRAVFVANV